MTSWFDEAKFGIFVHWDHASQQGIEISWPMAGRRSNRQISVDGYGESAATFNPTAWDARRLVGFLRRCGARYVVFTTKHHAGFSMFHTEFSDYSIANAPYRRDLVEEFVAAAHEEGLKVGLYYSLSDWHNEYYPALSDGDLPYEFGKTPPYPGDGIWEKYLVVLFGQVRELLTNYGHIDAIWFDGEWERTPEQWRAHKLAAEIRDLSPHTLINDRLPGQGDFVTPEQSVPPVPPEGRWETCMTMNETWGYDPDDTRYKSWTSIVRCLVETAAGGGNLLLNVSPTGSGAVPPEQDIRLRSVGRWLVDNGDAIFGTEVSGLEPWQFRGPTTRNADTLYLHILGKPLDALELHGVQVRRITRVWELSSGQPLSWEGRVEAHSKAWLQADPRGSAAISYPASLWRDQPAVVGVQFGPGRGPTWACRGTASCHPSGPTERAEDGTSRAGMGDCGA